jgi:hypothetical protein
MVHDDALFLHTPLQIVCDHQPSHALINVVCEFQVGGAAKQLVEGDLVGVDV